MAKELEKLVAYQQAALKSFSAEEQAQIQAIETAQKAGTKLTAEQEALYQRYSLKLVEAMNSAATLLASGAALAAAAILF